MRYKTLYLLFAYFACLTCAYTQNFKLTATAATIGENDVVQVEYTVSGANSADDFSEPRFAGWQVVSGPNFSQEQTYINGSFTLKLTYGYMLAPLSTGKLIVPSASIRLNEKRVTCNSLTIDVKPGTLATGGTPQSPVFGDFDIPAISQQDVVLKPGENAAGIVKKNIFLKVETSKKSVYVGEALLVTYKLYTALKGQSKVIKQPSFNSSSVIEMTTDELPEYESVNGKPFKVFLIRKVQLFPLQPGKLLLDNASIENEFEYYVQNDIYPRMYKSTLSTQPLSIEVKPVPVTQEYSGAVGSFTISSSVGKKQVGANDANVLKMEITGQGNFQVMKAPEVIWPPSIEAFDMKESSDLNKLNYPVTGKKVLEIPFIAHREGSFTIPGVSFTFFNPATAAIETSTSKPVTIIVTKQGKPVLPDGNKQIEPAPDNMKYVWIAPAICLVAAFIWAYNTRGNKQEKKDQVTSIEEKQVVEAKHVFYPNDIDFDLKLLNTAQPAPLFVQHIKTAVERALQNWQRDNDQKLGVLLEKLSATQPEVYNETSILLNKCDRLLYSGIAEEAEKETLQQQAIELIAALKKLSYIPQKIR